MTTDLLLQFVPVLFNLRLLPADVIRHVWVDVSQPFRLNAEGLYLQTQVRKSKLEKKMSRWSY